MQSAATEYPNLYSAVKTPLTSNLVFAYKQNDDIWSLPNKIDISSGYPATPPTSRQATLNKITVF
jgi:hypothetical protein